MFPIVKRNRSQHKCQRNRHLASCAISPPKPIPNLSAIKPEKDGILSRHPLVHTITAKNLPSNFGNPSKQESHCLNWKDVTRGHETFTSLDPVFLSRIMLGVSVAFVRKIRAQDLNPSLQYDTYQRTLLKYSSPMRAEVKWTVQNAGWYGCKSKFQNIICTS